MMSLFLKPNLMATLIAVILVALLNYYHGAPNPLVGAVVFGLLFFGIFSAFMAWVDRRSGK